uniref:Altered inheritance of mitochondria protein 24, mitochondrial n=1 Tax=Panagrolaimus sp. ES5 TaxID=591445 RepID=A0AC34FGJ6_9BILA
MPQQVAKTAVTETSFSTAAAGGSDESQSVQAPFAAEHENLEHVEDLIHQERGQELFAETGAHHPFIYHRRTPAMELLEDGRVVGNAFLGSEKEDKPFYGMNYKIEHRDTNSILYVMLQPQAKLHALPGSMVAMSPQVDLKGKSKFSLKNLFTGGQMAISTFTGPGEVLLAPPLCLGKAMFSGEGLFIHHISGQGIFFIHSLGAIVERHLQPNEEWIVDNGHLVAWNCNYLIERASSSGLMSNMLSGEGLVCRFTGPGTVYIQTRNPETLSSWIRGHAKNA